MAKFEIGNDVIDFAEFMLPPEERARIITPMTAKESVIELSVGRRSYEGLRLPFRKASNLVRFQPGKVSLWTGKTHHGKTQLLKQLMLYAVSVGERPAIASMEETPDEVLLDLCRMGTLQDQPDAEWIDVFLAWLDKKLWIYDQQNLVKPEQIIGVMNYLAKHHHITQFVLDSWMRMDMDGDDFDWHRKFINLLGAHAKVGGVHVHIVVHMTKGDGKEGPQSFETVRGSGDIINQVDKIFNVWRNKKPRHERHGGIDGGEPDGLLICEKQRGRPNWIGTMPIWMHRSSGQFLAERTDLPSAYLPGVHAGDSATAELAL